MPSFASTALRSAYQAPFAIPIRRRMLAYSLDSVAIDTATPLFSGRKLLLPTGAFAKGALLLKLSCQQGPMPSGPQTLQLALQLGPAEADNIETSIVFDLPEASTSSYYSLDLRLLASPDAPNSLILQGNCQAQVLLASSSTFATTPGQITQPLATPGTDLVALPSISLMAQLDEGSVVLGLLEWLG